VTPVQRVASLLLDAGFKELPLPLQIASLDFDIACAFVGTSRSADLVIVGDMAAEGEVKVLRQIQGIARALDVMRSRRPLTSVIVGPRPAGTTLEGLSQVGRMLPVGEADDESELRDRLAVLLPLKVRAVSPEIRDLNADQLLVNGVDELTAELLDASALGEEEVKNRFHAALLAIFPQSDGIDEDTYE